MTTDKGASATMAIGLVGADDAAEHTARRFASAMVLDRDHASTEFGNIVFAAINSVRR